MTAIKCVDCNEYWATRICPKCSNVKLCEHCYRIHQDHHNASIIPEQDLVEFGGLI